MSEKVVRLVYTTSDVAYLGYVDPNEIGSPKNGIKIEKPFAINIRPVEKEGKLEGVVLDVLLPVEFGGIAVAEGIYSGFVNFLTGAIELPNGKTHYMSNATGEKLAVNRVASIADRDNPHMVIYNISKIMAPSIEVEMIYKAKVISYNELLFAPRAVDFQPNETGPDNDQPPDQPPTSPPDDQMTHKGNVIEMTSKLKH